MFRQTLQQKLLGKLSPQQIQMMKLLQVPTVELEARIKQELEANPALEELSESYDDDSEEREGPEDGENEDGGEGDALSEFDYDDWMDDETPDYKLNISNRSADDEERSIPFVSGATFREQLIDQLAFTGADPGTRSLAEHLIGNLDEAGYLRRDLDSIVNDLAFTQGIETTRAALEAALAVVQTLDPAGVGASDLQECLLLQLRRRVAEAAADGTSAERRRAQRLGLDILEHHFEAFTKKHYDRIAKRLDLDDVLLKAALDEVIRLNPKPGNSGHDGSRTQVQHVIPDFLLAVEDEELRLQLNARNAPELRVSADYRDMMRTYAVGAKRDPKQREALAFIKQKVDAARWFVDAIRQRQHTLTVTMQAIVEHQHSYFLSGDETDLKPMILKDIADRVGMDISTVSRVANSKYVQTPYGTFLLKSFFSESLSTDSGEEVSSREVKKMLKDAIEGEDKSAPLPDEKLVAMLNAQGYNIARRTVAKYREQLGIPVARLRRAV